VTTGEPAAEAVDSLRKPGLRCPSVREPDVATSEADHRHCVVGAGRGVLDVGPQHCGAGGTNLTVLSCRQPLDAQASPQHERAETQGGQGQLNDHGASGMTVN
jgi:hypothetical protein